MAKKLGLLMASLAVIAFAVPAAASAAPAVTDSPGVLLAPGAKFQLTNIGPVFMETAVGKLPCNTFDMTGELTHNTGSTVRGVGIGEGTATGCIVDGKERKTTDVTLKELHFGAAGQGTMSITFATHVMTGITCHFESTNLPFAYASGSDVIKVTKGKLKATPVACEPSLVTGEFTIETDGGGSVILD